jgi:hypothetical protein
LQKNKERLLQALWIEITNLANKEIDLPSSRIAIIKRSFKRMVNKLKAGNPIRV